MKLLKNIKFYFKKRKKIKNLQKKIRSFNNLNKSLKKELIFNTSLTPKVSIIIPFYNELNYTYNCLNYLHDNINSLLKYEIILIDDNSSSKIDLSTYKGLKTIINNERVGFIKSVNLGIRESVGEYIYTLNSNTAVQKGFLEELFFVFNNFKNVGAVVPKLLNTNGSLQLEGTTFFNNYEERATKKESFYPDVNYIHRVDCCSDYNLLFKKHDDNGNINLFDEQFDTSYFNKLDFCFVLKYSQNKNIYYTPFSEIVHLGKPTNSNEKYKEQSSDDKKGILFNTNLNKFEKKWQTQLNAIQASSVETRIEELYNNKSIVFFVGIIPPYDKDSGSNRLKEIIQAFLDLGYYVLLVKDKTYLDESDYIEYYQRLGVNVFYEHSKSVDLPRYLKQTITNKTIAWFYNPEVFFEYYTIAEKYLPQAKLIYDMVDIHHLRFKRALELEPTNKKHESNYKKLKDLETFAATRADYVLTISDFDQNYMKQFCDISKIITISNVHYLKTTIEKTLPFEQRNDILFIGSIHEPNIDALYFLYKEIMPLVWQKIPTLKVNIIGNIQEKIKDIDNQNFIFKGYVPNIEALFLSNKLMIAPLRYGAGVKGKIGQAFEYFLPVVTTSIGAEGMQLINGENALINDDAIGFANSIIELYSNKNIWLKLQSNSEKSLFPFSKEKLKMQISKII